MGTKVGSATHRASPHGHDCWRSRQRASDRRTHAAGRRFQGFQPARAAGGLKNNYPGKCGAFLQGTPAHFKVQACAHLDGCGSPPVSTGIRLGSSVTRCFPLEEPPYHQGARGRRLGSGAAPQRGDKAHGRLKGGRRRLGYVMRGSKAAHVAGERIGSACDLEGSDERIDRGRASPRLARHGSQKEPGQVRVTTANGCFMTPRPTDTASGLLVIDGSCGRHTRLDAKLTSSRWVLSRLTDCGGI